MRKWLIGVVVVLYMALSAVGWAQPQIPPAPASSFYVQDYADMEPGRSLFDLGGLLVELQEILGCPVDVVTANGLKERIRDKVMSEAVGL